MSKKTRYYEVAALCTVLVFSFFIFDNHSFVKNYPPRGGSIVAFGDSLVFGTGATEGKNFVSLLSGMIGKPIENLGVPGDTTEMGLAHIDAVIRKHPSVVLLLLGGNDSLHRVPREQTFKNLDSIVSRLQNDGILVVLLGVRGGLFTDNFDTEFEELAKRRKTAFVPDVLDGLFGHPKFMSDEIHPNDDGYAVIAQKIYPVLVGVLPKSWYK